LVLGDNSGQGIFGFVAIGGDVNRSLALREELVKALAGRLTGVVFGQGRGAAWLSVPTRRASDQQIRAALRAFGDCLA
jgi:hypothetical protein